MAINNCDEGKLYFQGIVDGSCNLPVSSCFQLLKPGLDEVNPHCSLDVLPVLFDDASFPVRLKCPFHNSQGQDVYSISVLPDDGITNPQCEPQIAFLNFLEVSNPFKSQMCPDTQLNCKSCVGLQMESSDTYSPCTVDMDIEKGSLETPKSNEETMGSLKTEGVLTSIPPSIRHGRHEAIHSDLKPTTKSSPRTSLYETKTRRCDRSEGGWGRKLRSTRWIAIIRKSRGKVRSPPKRNSYRNGHTGAEDFSLFDVSFGILLSGLAIGGI